MNFYNPLESHLDIKQRYNELLQKINVQGGAIDVADRLETLPNAIPKKIGILSKHCPRMHMMKGDIRGDMHVLELPHRGSIFNPTGWLKVWCKRSRGGCERCSWTRACRIETSTCPTLPWGIVCPSKPPWFIYRTIYTLRNGSP